MKLAFSTLGCPQWSLNEVMTGANAYGYQAIELRALSGGLNLLDRPEFQPGQIAETRRRLSEHNLTVCSVDTSCKFDSPDREERLGQIETALRHCELASALGAPMIRVFPDKIHEGATRAETAKWIADSLHQLAERAPADVRIALETHGDFAHSAETVGIIQRADHQALGIIWDVANSLEAGDTVKEAAQTLRPYLLHVHLRDARPTGKEHWQPVLAGSGVVPFGEVVETLLEHGFNDYLSFEWEKHWHPEIEEPEIALPDFIRAIKNVLSKSEGRVDG